jgi:glycosyltransferase involved in cell wall biosynthesis
MKVYYNNLVVTLFEGFYRGIGQSFVHTLKAMDSKLSVEKFLLHPIFKSDCAQIMWDMWGIGIQGIKSHWDFKDYVRIEEETEFYPLDAMFESGLVHTWDNYPAKTRNRQIVTVHDTFWCAKKYRKYRVKNGPDEFDIQERFNKYADFVVCPSAFSAADFLEFMGDWPGDRIEVIPWGSKFDTYTNDRDVGDYFLYVSVPEKRKNFHRVIEAYRKGEFEQPLKVVADMSILEPEIKRELAGLACAGMQFLGKVTDKELVGLYRDATALIFPSALEGFGMPAVEAASQGCPVILNQSSSMKEFDFGYFVNEENIVEELIDGMRTMLDSTQRKDWIKAAESYKKIYQKVLGE